MGPDEVETGTEELADSKRSDSHSAVSHSDIDPAVLELDHVFSVLGHPRRRYLMYALSKNPAWTLTELATKLAAWEDDCTESDVNPNHRDQIYISLYHTHVPKLVDENVVDFDTESETIAQARNATQVLAVLAGAGGSLDFAQERHAERPYGAEGAEE